MLKGFSEDVTSPAASKRVSRRVRKSGVGGEGDGKEGTEEAEGRKGESKTRGEKGEEQEERERGAVNHH